MVIGSKVIFKDSLESTNDYASGLLKLEKQPEGTVVHTNYQTAGRGQQGNSWESEPGKNLLLSIILYPGRIKPEDQFIISMAFSLGVLDFVKNFTKGCSIKWPNDILAGDAKIAGLLIENSILNDRIIHTIAGIGLNMNQMEFNRYSPPAASLKSITGKDYDLKESVKQLLVRLDRRYKQLLSGKSPKMKNEYISSMYGFMSWRSFRTGSGRILSGRIIGISQSGQLMVEAENSTIANFNFKEIEFM